MKAADIMVPLQQFLVTDLTEVPSVENLPAGIDFLPVIDTGQQVVGTIDLAALRLQKNAAALYPGGFLDLQPYISQQVPRIAADDDLDALPGDVTRAVVVDAAGKAVGLIGATDLLGCLRKKLAEFKHQLSLSKELADIIESSYDGIWVTDGQGNVLAINSAYERLSGIKFSEVRGKNMQQLVDGRYFDQSATLLVIKEKKRVTINQLIKGTRRMLVTGNPVFNEQGELSRVVTNVRDVTDLVNLQKQLARTKEQTLKYETELSHLRSLHIQDDDIIYRSQTMARAVELALKIAEVDSTVFITGESGTGKDVIAKFIHKHGKGTAKPFIKINCAAIPDQLLESELFGYEGGAFSGARKEGKPGMFELAHKGTLFLDEVGDLPLMLQAKLLRAIQEKEVLRVGGTQVRSVNVRIIAATHRNMAEMVKAGHFRKDLYYRLMVVPIHLTPLRERREDIPPLIKHFVDRINKRYDYSKRLSPEVMSRLVEYSWPGNIRELENVLERMIVTAGEDELTPDLLPEAFSHKVHFPGRGTKLKAAVEETEAYLLAEAYRETPSWAKVAASLGVDRATVFRKAAKYGLLKKEKE
ncbi:sigma 54-interacting transcriptional regulator [Acetonema longum]|uniref:HTH-type transcriptional regulatory protein TyrR n=1 Tax=Acetonema longum DSM 6540 TaxID=1009370 RepID=F7NMF9_9FIRM|nr:sigma 54-interacting transcriptional regulator [Acetonema longum]EGO62775.1 sigma54 specific transcriptional regulator [Acetonema longum DSM 6540]